MGLETGQEQDSATQANGKQGNNNAQAKGKNQETNVVRKAKELSPVLAGESIESGDFNYKFSSISTPWKKLKTGDTFSRSKTGKVVYMRTSKTMAYPLDKGLDSMHIPDDSQNLEVYRVWINTF
jgi:hypothetical protein